MPVKKIKRDYKWAILVVCFFMEFACLGFCCGNAGMYLTAITEALDIERSLFSISTSIRYIVTTIIALFLGNLVHRLGTKKLVFIGLCALIGSTLTYALANEVYHFYFGGALLGVGVTFVGSTMAGTIVRQWFHENVGKYTGIVLSANGIGAAISAQIISPLINSGDPFGYRNAYLLSAAILVGISILIMIFLREKPSENPAPVSKTKKPSRGALWDGIEYSVVRKKPYFYLAAAMVFLSGISLQSIGSITIAYLTDVGLPAAFVANVATVSSLFLTASKIIVGFSYDKRGLGFTLLTCHIAAIVAFAMKALITNSTMGMVLAMISVVLTSFATPLETVMLPLLANDLFGSASYNKVLGIFLAMNSMGLCLGSPIGNLYYDLLGTYLPCFLFFCVLMTVVAVLFQFVVRAAHKDKAAILEAQG